MDHHHVDQRLHNLTPEQKLLYLLKLCELMLDKHHKLVDRVGALEIKTEGKRPKVHAAWAVCTFFTRAVESLVTDLHKMDPKKFKPDRAAAFLQEGHLLATLLDHAEDLITSDMALN